MGPSALKAGNNIAHQCLLESEKLWPLVGLSAQAQETAPILEGGHTTTIAAISPGEGNVPREGVTSVCSCLLFSCFGVSCLPPCNQLRTRANHSSALPAGEGIWPGSPKAQPHLELCSCVGAIKTVCVNKLFSSANGKGCTLAGQASGR